MVTLSSCLICLPPNEYACAYAWTTLGTGPAIDLQKMPILGKKNHFFRWSSFWYRQVCKQAKLSHLCDRKPARIHWKADAHKTSHCLLRILVQMHNWVNFIRKWARRGRYSQWRTLSGYTRPVFEDRIISRRADVVSSPRSCDLTPLDYYLWGAVRDKCYADKPGTIDALKDNIREVIGEVAVV